MVLIFIIFYLIKLTISKIVDKYQPLKIENRIFTSNANNN